MVEASCNQFLHGLVRSLPGLGGDSVQLRIELGRKGNFHPSIVGVPRTKTINNQNSTINNSSSAAPLPVVK